MLKCYSYVRIQTKLLAKIKVVKILGREFFMSNLNNLIPSHIHKFFDSFQDFSILQLMRKLKTTGTQVSQEFIDATIANIKANYGDVDEKRIYEAFAQPCHALCANHAGFENMNELLHSSLLSQLACEELFEHDSVLFSCETITPLCPTVPAGFQFSQRDQGSLVQANLSLISRKYDSCFVPQYPPITLESIKNRLKTISVNDINVSELNLIHALQAQLQKEQAIQGSHGRILEGCDSLGETFLEQTYRFNSAALKRFLSPVCSNTTYYVGEEPIAVQLMVQDLAKDNSQLASLYDNSELCLKLIEALSNHDNCWADTLIVSKDETPHGFGTVFFYYISPQGKRYPLGLKVDGEKLILWHNKFSCELNAQNIALNLNEGRFVPNVYTVYMVMAFLHNVSIAGGIFLTHYLKAMLRITSQVLGWPCPSCVANDMIQALLIPIRVLDHSSKMPLTKARAMMLADLLYFDKLDLDQAEKLMQSKIIESKPLSLQDMLLLTKDSHILKSHMADLLLLGSFPSPLNYHLEK